MPTRSDRHVHPASPAIHPHSYALLQIKIETMTLPARLSTSKKRVNIWVTFGNDRTVMFYLHTSEHFRTRRDLVCVELRVFLLHTSKVGIIRGNLLEIQQLGSGGAPTVVHSSLFPFLLSLNQHCSRSGLLNTRFVYNNE